MPAYPTEFNVLVNDHFLITKGQSLVIDKSFYDRFDNLV